jgi:hypothetical protein
VTGRRPPAGYHVCPCACGGIIPDRIFACRAGWARLPVKIRGDIQRTASLRITNPERADIIIAAIDFYREHPTTKGGHTR